MMKARAAVCEKVEADGQLVIKDIDLPEVGPDQVLIEIRFAAVNLNETIKIGGTHHEKPTVPFVPGAEVAGRVLAVGLNVRSICPGDRIAAMLQRSVGGWATHAIADQGKVLKIPDRMPFDVACGFCGGYLTAYDALVTVGELKQFDRLVITGAAGGVGLGGVQIAKALGVPVIGIAGGSAKCSLVKASGADHIIDHTTEDPVASVFRLTDGKGASIVMEVCGGDMLRKAMKFTGFDGRVVITGFTSLEVPEIRAIHLLLKGIQLRGAHLALRGQKDPGAVAQQARALFDLYAKDLLTPHVSRTFQLEDAQQAISFIKERLHTGKVVLQTSSAIE